MFICDGCGLASKPRERENKVVVEKRKKTYQVYRTFWTRRTRDSDSKKVTRFVREAIGWEIIKEVKLCRKCHKTYLEKSSEEVKV